jgi:DNA repair exonuclease SbcCD ATPase subunit
MPTASQEPGDHSFERAITTLCNCRSIIRHHPQLSAAQRDQLLADLEKTLSLLQDYATREAREAILSGQIAAHMTQEQHTLRALYQLYQEHLTAPQTSAETLKRRFNEALKTLSELQNLIQEYNDLYLDQDGLIASLQRVGAFTADLYCLFMEFRRSLSSILDEQSSYIHTEELSSLHRRASASLEEPGQTPPPPHGAAADLEETCRSLEARRQRLTRTLGDTAALLTLVESGLRSDLNRRAEVVAHLRQLPQLFAEIDRLLADYETTLRALL